MQQLPTDVVLSKVTKITLGIGIFSLSLIFIALPVPGSAVLGEILMISGIIQISRGFLSLSKEKIKGRNLYFVSSLSLIVLAILMLFEFFILLFYIGLGLDLVSYLGFLQALSLGSNSGEFSINFAKVILIFAAIVTLILIASFNSLGNELEERRLNRDSLFLISILFFLITLYFGLYSISNIDGYLRPLLFFIINLYYSSNYPLLAIGLITISSSIYAVLRVYLAIGDVVQREFKKKYNLPY